MAILRSFQTAFQAGGPIGKSQHGQKFCSAGEFKPDYLADAMPVPTGAFQFVQIVAVFKNHVLSFGSPVSFEAATPIGNNDDSLRLETSAIRRRFSAPNAIYVPLQNFCRRAFEFHARRRTATGSRPERQRTAL